VQQLWDLRDLLCVCRSVVPEKWHRYSGHINRSCYLLVATALHRCCTSSRYVETCQVNFHCYMASQTCVASLSATNSSAVCSSRKLFDVVTVCEFTARICCSVLQFFLNCSCSSLKRILATHLMLQAESRSDLFSERLSRRSFCWGMATRTTFVRSSASLFLMSCMIFLQSLCISMVSAGLTARWIQLVCRQCLRCFGMSAFCTSFINIIITCLVVLACLSCLT